jgi:hypothetical protein
VNSKPKQLKFNVFATGTNKTTTEKKFELEKVEHKLKKQENIIKLIYQLKEDVVSTHRNKELITQMKEEEQEFEMIGKNEQRLILPQHDAAPIIPQNLDINEDLDDIVERQKSSNNGILGTLDKIIMKESKAKKWKLEQEQIQNNPAVKRNSVSPSLDQPIVIIDQKNVLNSQKSKFVTLSKDSDKELANILANVVFEDDESKDLLAEHEISTLMKEADTVIKNTKLLEKHNSVKTNKIDKLTPAIKKRATGFLDHLLKINVSAI